MVYYTNLAETVVVNEIKFLWYHLSKSPDIISAMIIGYPDSHNLTTWHAARWVWLTSAAVISSIHIKLALFWVFWFFQMHFPLRCIYISKYWSYDFICELLHGIVIIVGLWNLRLLGSRDITNENANSTNTTYVNIYYMFFKREFCHYLQPNSWSVISNGYHRFVINVCFWHVQQNKREECNFKIHFIRTMYWLKFLIDFSYAFTHMAFSSLKHICINFLYLLLAWMGLCSHRRSTGRNDYTSGVCCFPFLTVNNSKSIRCSLFWAFFLVFECNVISRPFSDNSIYWDSVQSLFIKR